MNVGRVFQTDQRKVGDPANRPMRLANRGDGVEDRLNRTVLECNS
jgi:hypothetical protein